jgi:hypothetical protein
MAMFVLAAAWTGVGVWALADGDYVRGGFDVALGVWGLLIGFFGDRYTAWFEATLERQRSEVHGQGAITFLPASTARSQDQ